MKKLPPDTFLLTLPDGRKVTCWRRDAAAIRRDVETTGNVFLSRPDGGEVYDRIDPRSLESAALTPGAERIDG